MTERKPKESLVEKNRQLRTRIEELEAVLYAIRSGEIDALVLSKPEGEQVLPLQGALEPYRVMVETMGEGMISLSVDSAILYCNAHFAELVLMPRERIIGLPLHDMIAEPDRKKFDEMISRGLEELMRGELTLLASDGMEIPVQLSMSPLPESDGKAVSVVVTDLTEVATAAQTRTLLALIVESSDDAIVSTTLDGVISSWNTAAMKLYGYTADEAIGRTIDSLIVPHERSNEVIQELEAIGRGEYNLLADTVRLSKDGTRIDMSIKASPILDDAGKVLGASINSRDITQHKRMQEERDRATYLLGERLKEISCLHAVSTIVGESELSIEQRLQRVVERIPPGFQFPEVTCARIILADTQYSSADFKETAWRLACDIEEESGEGGSLEVFCRPERPAGEEGAFLREERDLVNTIGRILGDFLRLEHSLSQLTRFRDLVDASNDAVFVIEPRSALIVDVNSKACDALGYSRDELLRLQVIDVDAMVPKASVWDEVVKEIKKTSSMLLEGEHRRKDGSTFPVEVGVRYASRDEDDYIIAIARDITKRKEAEEKLRANEKLLQRITSQVPGILYQYRMTPDGTRTMPYVSEGAGNVGDIFLKELDEGPDVIMSAILPEDIDHVEATILESARTMQPWKQEFRIRHRDGSIRWLSGNSVPTQEPDGSILWYGLLMDVTERKLTEDKIHLLAITDELTGIANRREFTRRLQKEIDRTKRYGGSLALIMYDLDNFKKINDTYGHDKGDDVLKTVTDLVNQNIRRVDLNGRWGGEEFMVMLPESNREAGRKAADKIRQTIAQHPFDKVDVVTTSFGVVELRPADTIDSLLKRVDDALYQAKLRGRNRVELC